MRQWQHQAIARALQQRYAARVKVWQTICCWWQRRVVAKEQRQRYESIVRNLPMRVPFDAYTFCQDLAAQRDRPILLIPVAFHGKIFGLVISDLTADYIFYEQNTSPLHQQQIIMHEVSHLIFDHHVDSVIPEELLAELLPVLHSVLGQESLEGLVRHVLGRGGELTKEEIEAEELTAHILKRAALPNLEVFYDGGPGQ